MAVEGVTGGGLRAPTSRHRVGVLLIVPMAMHPRGCMVFTALGGEPVRLIAVSEGEEVELTGLDGRHRSAEAAVSFTGRVLGLYAVEGTVAFAELRYAGSEQQVRRRRGVDGRLHPVSPSRVGGLRPPPPVAPGDVSR
ncbi:hypothetical protein [Blastococcus montanus]|uniref:hypothetical protein n=1 Tax=Blastococcus montanus TaxID=3144973 RepID=UPI00320B8F0E